MLGREEWHADTDEQSSATVRSLKLMIRKADNCARYLVFGRVGSDEAACEIMLASGTEPNVSEAMMAAERTAARIEPIFAGRLKTVARIDC